MREKFLLLAALYTIATPVLSQYRIEGKVMNARLEPLAFANVEIRGTRLAGFTKEDGSFYFTVEKGVYELAVTMVGYKPTVVKLFINKDTVQQHVILEEQLQSMATILVKGKYKDRAEDFIKNIIRHKEAIQAAAGAYTTYLYIKAVREDSLRQLTKKKDADKKKDTAHLDLQQMAMAEIGLQLDYQSPARYKEERIGVTKRGNVQPLFYLTTTDGRFDLYDNLIKVPALSPMPFVSPVSYSGLVAYRYKTLRIEKKNNHTLYTISFKPGSLSNATLEGELVVDDSCWVVLQARYTFPVYHLPQYDFFEVQQTYEYVNHTAWMVTRQQFRYYSKSNKGKASGYTNVVYKNFELNKIFPKNYFGVEVSVATDSTYKRDSSFWNKVRTTPLSEKEVRFIRYKDSIYTHTHSKAYLDSIDRKINTVTWQNIVYKNQRLSNHEKGTIYVFPSIASIVGPYIFSYGGIRIGLPFFFSKTNITNRKSIMLYSDVSMGLLNKDINGSISLRKKYNAFNQAYYTLTAKRDFAMVFEGDAWINQLKRTNYYLDNRIGAGWGREIVNGLMLNVNMDIALRRSLEGYKTYGFVDTIFIKNLNEKDNKPPVFDPYNALYSMLELRYTPFQPYIREPLEKILLHPKWPTFYVQWKKGAPGILASKVDFDYWEWGIQQTLHVGLAGIGAYTLKSGSFFNKKDLRYVDYKFQRRGDPILFMNPELAFQALDSTFPVFKRFYEAHYFHEFNGAVLNKIPLFKKIGLREVAGAGFLWAKERNLAYAEAFAGVERVFKLPFSFLQKVKLGGYVVSSVANQFSNPIQFKFGITTWSTQSNKWQ